METESKLLKQKYLAYWLFIFFLSFSPSTVCRNWINFRSGSTLTSIADFADLLRGMENQNTEILVISGIIFLIIAVISSLGNSFILYIVKRDPLKCFNKPTNVFNISLTMAHLLGGVIVIPFTGVLNILRAQHPNASLPSAVLKLEAVLLNFNIGTATLFLFAISTERFTAVVVPRLNKKWLTMRRAKNISYIATVSCFVWCLFLFLPNSKTFFYIVYLHVFILLPVCGILTSCAVRLRSFKKQARVSVIDNGLPIAQLFVRERRRRNSQLVHKLLVTVFSILVPVLIALLLFYTVKIIETTCEECLQQKWFSIFSNASLVFLYLSSALNPLVLYSRIPEYSRSIKHIFRK